MSASLQQPQGAGSESHYFSSDFLVQQSRPSRVAFVPELTRRMSQYFETRPMPSPPIAIAPPSTPDILEPVDVHEEDRSKSATRDPDISSTTDYNLNASSLPQSKWQSAEMLGSNAVPFAGRFKPALTLQNRGSVARDHLASERTFLAYVRTSLAISSAGVALVQLLTISSHVTTDGVSYTPSSRKLQVYARPLGATAIIMGLVVLAIGITRYFSVQRALTKGMFPVARLTVATISIVLGTLVAVVFGALIRR